MPSVLIVRGHLASPWELRPWLELPERYEVSYLLTRSNRLPAVDELHAIPARALRDLLPRGAFWSAFGIGRAEFSCGFVQSHERGAATDVRATQ